MTGRQSCCYKETKVGTRAGSHRRYTHRRETSAHQRRPPTPHMPQTAHYPYTSCTRQPADQGAAHASDQDTTHASLRCTRHRDGTNRQGKHGPYRGQSRNPPDRTYNERRGAGANISWQYDFEALLQRHSDVVCSKQYDAKRCGGRVPPHLSATSGLQNQERRDSSI